MNFEELVYQIELAHKELQSYAVRQVNNALTMRKMFPTEQTMARRQSEHWHNA